MVGDIVAISLHLIELIFGLDGKPILLSFFLGNPCLSILQGVLVILNHWVELGSRSGFSTHFIDTNRFLHPELIHIPRWKKLQQNAGLIQIFLGRGSKKILPNLEFRVSF